MENTKVCPTCEAEYYPEIQVCADCGTALEWAGAEVDPDAVTITDHGWDQFAETEILGQVAGDLEKAVVVYLAHLKHAGIIAATLPRTTYVSGDLKISYSAVFGNALTGGKAGQVPVGDVLNGYQYVIFVRQQDFEAAERIIAEQFAKEHPDLEKGFYREFELGGCPACDAPVGEDAEVCPDCGLSLGGP